MQVGMDAVSLLSALETNPWASVALVVLTLLGACSPMPGLFTSSVVAAGAIHGAPLGFVLIYPSACLGACTAFTLGRRGLRRWVPAKLLSVGDAVANGGLATLILLRLTPLPVAASSVAFGAIPRITPLDHGIATAIGFLRLGAHVYVGACLRNAGQEGAPGHTVELAIKAASVALLTCSVGQVARLVLLQHQSAKAGGKS